MAQDSGISFPKHFLNTKIPSLVQRTVFGPKLCPVIDLSPSPAGFRLSRGVIFFELEFDPLFGRASYLRAIRPFILVTEASHRHFRGAVARRRRHGQSLHRRLRGRPGRNFLGGRGSELVVGVPNDEAVREMALLFWAPQTLIGGAGVGVGIRARGRALVLGSLLDSEGERRPRRT